MTIMIFNFVAKFLPMSYLAVIWDVSPAIFSSGSFELRYYSVFFAIAFIISYIVVKYIYQKEGIPIKELDSLTVWVVVGGLLGARIGHCIFYEWSYYKYNIMEIILPFRFQPDFHFTGFQGLASHGGAIGIIIALLIFRYQSKMKSFLWLIDRVAVPTGFAGAMIRFGNLMNSEIYGHQTDLPWGFIFVQNGDSFASHPTQIYEALLYLLTSLILLFLYNKAKYRNARGFLFGLFLILTFASRFFIEFVKEIQVDFEANMMLNMGQILSIPAVMLGLFFVLRAFYIVRNEKKQQTL